MTVDGRRIEYSEHGEGERVVVLLHALLQSHRMQAPLAQALADRGRRAICLNLLAEREPGERLDPARFAAPALARQLLGALDELGVAHAVLLGTSIGGNVAMEAALIDPSRVDGLVLEGPFLENGVRATGFGWSGLVAGYTLGRPLLRVVGAAARLIPHGRGFASDMARDLLRQDPERAAAFLAGLTFGRIGPPREERASISVPALVIGYPVDPFHPMSDARAVVGELPDARLVSTRSILDLRRPGRRADGRDHALLW